MVEKADHDDTIYIYAVVWASASAVSREFLRVVEMFESRIATSTST